MTRGSIVLLPLFSALLVVTCVSTSPEPPTGSVPSSTAIPTPIVSTPPVGVPGGTLTAIAFADVPHLDVHQTVSETLASRGPGIAYSRLLRLRSDGSVAQPSLGLECDLCQSWEMLNPLNYRFQLRKDARWQDLPPVGGRRLVASDLVFSYQRQRTEGWPNAPLISGMDTVKAEGDSTLKVTLKFPDVDFLLALADGHSKVVAREVAQGPGGLKEGPVIGTGPWTLRHTAKGVGSDFEPNPNYYEDRLPLLRHLSFKVIEDADVRLAAFVTGSVDVYDLLPQEWAVLQATEADYKTFQSRQGGRGLVLAMNVNRPPFNDGNLRRGVFKALDPWANLEEIWAGQGFVGAGVPVVEADWLLDRPELGKLFGGPPAFGSRPGDVAIVFDLMVADFGDVYLDQGLSVERDLRSAGFDPRLRVLNPIEYSELVWERKEYQLFVGPVPPATSPNSYLFSVLHSGGQWNILAHNDPVLNGLIESQQRAPFRSIERGETFRAIQRHLLEQAYMFGLVGHATTWALQQRVEGLYPNTALSEYFYWAEAWVVDD